MKIISPRFDLIRIIAPLSIILSLILYWFFAPDIVLGFRLHWILLGLIIAVIFSPWGKIRFSSYNAEKALEHKPLYPWRSWLLRIFAIQFFLGLIFAGIACFCTQTSPAVNAPKAIFSSTLFQFCYSFGLFPWALVAITTIGFGYWSFCKKQNAYVSSLLYPIFHSSPMETAGLVTNFMMRLGTLGAFTTTIAFMILIIAYVFGAFITKIATGFSLAMIIVSLLFLIIGLTKPFERFLKTLFSSQAPVLISLLITIVILSFILIFLSWMFDMMNQVTLKTPILLKKLQQKDWNVYWMFFAICWWISWIPITSIYIAKISCGYSIRQIIIGLLVLPLFIGIILGCLTYFKINISFNHPTLIELFSLVGFVGLFYLITQKKFLPSLVLSYLPKEGQYKRREYYFLIRNSIKLAVMAIYLFLPAGMFGISMYLYAVIITYFLLNILVIISFVMMISKKPQYSVKI